MTKCIHSIDASHQSETLALTDTYKYTVDPRLVGILSNFENGKDPVSVRVAEPFDVFQPNVHRYLVRPIERNYYIFMTLT